MLWSSVHAFLVAGAALSTTSARAEEVRSDPFALSPEQLFSAEVISVSRSEQSVWEAPAAIYVISGADIERAGAQNIPEALRLAPGVQVGRGGTSGWAVSVRGFNSPLANKLLVLIDGREVYDPLFSGVYWDVQDTVLEDIERIEVVRGPGASLWGANAVNGVINIITRPATETQGGLASVVSGDQERGGLSLRYGGTIGLDGGWRVFARAFDRDGQETLAGADDNSAWQAWHGGFRTDFNANPRHAFTIQGDIYRSRTGQLRNVPSLSPPYAAIERERITAEGGNLLGRWTWRTDGLLTAQAYIDYTRRAQRTLEDDRTTVDVDVQYELPELGAHNIVAGARYRHTRDEVTQTEIIRSADDTHAADLFSVFIQDQIRLAERWRLTLGAKFDENEYTGLEVQPNARLQWTGERNMIWASASRAVRTPSELEREFNILFAAAPPFPADTRPLTLELLPSPDFESEELVALELGYRRQWTPSLAMDVALFHNSYDGLATLTALTPQIATDPPRIILAPIIITNGTEARTDGGEIVLDWQARDNLNLSLSYSYLHMDLTGPTAALDAEAAEGQSPRQQANARVQWDITPRWSVDAVLYYADELPEYQIDAYTRADMRLRYELTGSVQLELVGQGLFDDEWREFGDPAEANAVSIGRSVFGRLTWRG